MTKVFLSPSSQENNTGAVKGYVEETVCNLIADVVQRELKRQETYDVMRNHPEESYVQHTARSNAWGAQLHICIHTNASNTKARGLNAGCMNPTDPSVKSTQLTRAIYNQLAPLTPAADKMIKYSFHEVTQTKCPCAYLELSFHDNLDDCMWILSHVEELGVGIAAGIVAYEKKVWIKAVVKEIVDLVTAPPVAPTPAAPVVVVANGDIVVGGKYSLAIMGNSSSDKSGNEVVLATIPATCLKIAPGTKNPYGMDYKGDGYVGAWFPENVIKF